MAYVYGGYDGCDDWGQYFGQYDRNAFVTGSKETEAKRIIGQLLRDNEVVVFTFSYCPPCKKTKALLDRKRVPYVAYELDKDPYISKREYIDVLEPLSGIRTVPQLFIKGKFYGGSVEARTGLERGEVQAMCGAPRMKAASRIRRLIQANDVVLFAFTYCGPCKNTKALLEKRGIKFLLFNLDTDPNVTQTEYMDALEPLSGIRTVPQLFIRGKFYGDSRRIRGGLETGEVQVSCGQFTGRGSNRANSMVRRLLRENEIIMFATTICNYSKRAKALLDDHGIPYAVHYVDTDPYIGKAEYVDALQPLSGIRTFPQLFVRGRFYGDSVQTTRGLESGELQMMCSV